MKKTLIISAFVALFCLQGFSQKIKDADVPDAVKTSFSKYFPGLAATWEKEKGNYEAGFKKNNKSMSAVFQPDGKWVETETAIKESELPAAVLSYVKTNYKGKPIKESAKITAADGTFTYEAEVEGKDLIFDSTGKFLKEVKD
jgi:hypothetical protein